MACRFGPGFGFTHHVVISMGCHIDPERFILGPIEREERRRVWAGLMMLYAIQNTSFGCLDQQMPSQNVKMPADVDDIDLLTGPTVCMTSDPTSSPSASQSTQMTFLLTVRLYKTSKMICRQSSAIPSRGTPCLDWTPRLSAFGRCAIPGIKPRQFKTLCPFTTKPTATLSTAISTSCFSFSIAMPFSPRRKNNRDLRTKGQTHEMRKGPSHNLSDPA